MLAVNKKVRALVSVAILAFLAWRLDWTRVANAFAGLRLELWLSAVGIYAVTQVVSAVRWRQLAVPLGFCRPLRQFVSFYFIGMFFNLLLPTSIGGDVVRAEYLVTGKGQRMPAFLSVFVDRFSGLLVLLLLACLAVALCPIDLPMWIPASVWGTGAAAVAGLATLPILTRWTHRFDRMRRLVGGVQLYLTMPRLIATSTALSIVVQAANVVVLWLAGLAIGADIPASYYWILVPMVTLLTLVPISLNGMGVREGGMVLFLAPLGVESATAVTLAFLWFMVFTATSLVGVVIYLAGNLKRPEEYANDGSFGSHSDQGRTRQSRSAA
jgi:uncharacterized membrane protein YbhN (UPF0104 family)